MSFSPISFFSSSTLPIPSKHLNIQHHTIHFQVYNSVPISRFLFRDFLIFEFLKSSVEMARGGLRERKAPVKCFEDVDVDDDVDFEFADNGKAIDPDDDDDDDDHDMMQK